MLLTVTAIRLLVTAANLSLVVAERRGGAIVLNSSELRLGQYATVTEGTKLLWHRDSQVESVQCGMWMV